MFNFVHHVHYVVQARDLSAKGNKLRGQDGITQSPRGYITANIEQDSAHGLWFQLAEG
jgi:hypothetical protein